MSMQSIEGDWLAQLVDWTTECEQKVLSLETRSDMIQDVNEDLKTWQERLRELGQQASGFHNQLVRDGAAEGVRGNILSLNAEAEKLKTEFEELMKEAVGSGINHSHVEESTEDERKSTKDRTVPIGKHTLPPLPYAYNALEPYISEAIMRLHHQEHHQGYIDGLNKAEKEMQKARRTGHFELIRHWEDEAAFNGAGHYLHTIFWENMSPDGGGKPDGEIAKEIKRTFGSFDKFKEHVTNAADKVQGVGWAMLVWSPRSRRVEILQAEKHQNLSQQDVIPLLVLDVWEHAYYLQYHNNRSDYIDAWWNVVCWDSVNRRFEAAKKVMWEPY